jgi:hypothetical protein
MCSKRRFIPPFANNNNNNNNNTNALHFSFGQFIVLFQASHDQLHKA